MELSSIFVGLMGISTLFLGLICMAVWRIAGSQLPAAEHQSVSSPAPVQYSAAAQAAPAAALNPELIAAVSAAIAEELGTDISGIRITSITKL